MKYVEYSMTVQSTPSADKNMLAGVYAMVVLKEEIILRRPGSQENVLQWPIVNIRKFKSEDASLDGTMDLVTIEGNM